MPSTRGNERTRFSEKSASRMACREFVRGGCTKVYGSVVRARLDPICCPPQVDESPPGVESLLICTHFDRVGQVAIPPESDLQAPTPALVQDHQSRAEERNTATGARMHRRVDHIEGVIVSLRSVPLVALPHRQIVPSGCATRVHSNINGITTTVTSDDRP